MVQTGSNDLKRLNWFQTMLKKSLLYLILRTYAQILCLFHLYFDQVFDEFPTEHELEFDSSLAYLF